MIERPAQAHARIRPPVAPLRSRTLRLSLAATLIALAAGCGDQKKPVSTARLNGDLQRAIQAARQRTGESTGPRRPAPPAPSRTYAVHLTGADAVPHGARGGTAEAVLRLVPRRHQSYGRVCWSFSNRHGFGNPTQAHIHEGTRGRNGLAAVSLGGYWRHAGCTTAANQLMIAIARAPGRYYLDIHTARYPAGTVRGQL